MKAIRLLLALCLCMLAPLAVGAPTFKIGDRPPPLEPMAWVKGAPVKGFEPGRVYVVKFFASWCGASNEGMEMMSERARRHAGEVTFIGVNVREAERAEPSVDALRRFVERKGRDLDYIVAMDDPQKKTLFDSWMLAAGSYSIPTAFIIGRDGRLAYLGIPIDYEAQYTFDRALEDAIAQKSDLAAARKLQAEMSELTAKRLEEMKVMKPLREALERKDYAAAVTAADEIAATEPKYAPYIFDDKLISLLHLDEARAFEFATQHVQDADRRKAMGAASEIEFWGRVAGVIAGQPDLSRGTYARAAQDLREWLAEDDDVFSWLQLATIEHRLGNLREAVAAQKRAIAAVDESDRISRDGLERLRSKLEQYERELAHAETPVPVAGVTHGCDSTEISGLAGCPPGTDVDVADIQRFGVPVELGLELRTIVGLEDVDAERERCRASSKNRIAVR